MPVAKDGLKKCPGCGEEKLVSDYYKNKGTSDKLTPNCKDCTNNYAYEYRKANRKHCAKQARERYKKNPWGSRAGHLNRKAGVKFATAVGLQGIYEQQSGRCYYCGVYLIPSVTASSGRRDGVTFDHVVPGIHKLVNLVAACGDCNRQKQDNTVESMKRFIRQIERHKRANPEEV